MSFASKLCIAASIGFVQICGIRAVHADALKYQFKGQQEVIYDVTIDADLPEGVSTTSGMLTYQIKDVDPSNGQIRFSYTSQLRTDVHRKDANATPSQPLSWAPGRSSADILISPQGNVLRSNRNDSGAQLPNLLGAEWQLMLPTLNSDGSDSWKDDRQIMIYDKPQQQKPQPPQPRRPGPPWMQQQPQQQASEERIDRPAHESVNYSLSQADGNVVPIKRELVLATDEKVDNTPLTQQAGESTYQFDTSIGMVKSLEAKYTLEFNDHNISMRVPIKVSVRLLGDDELKKIKAQRDAQEAEQKVAQQKLEEQVRVQQAQQQGWEQGKKKAQEVGMRTLAAGMSIGAEFTRVDAQLRPMIGARCTLGDWMGHRAFRHIEPLYEKPKDSPGSDGIDVLAKPGYAVAGVVVNVDSDHDKSIFAMQFIFMRLDNGKLNKSDQYRSEWISDMKETLAKVVVGGKGETVLGIFGRQGLNVDGFGLILRDPNATTAPAATSTGETPIEALSSGAAPTLKNLDDAWQKTSGTPTQLLSTMKGSIPDDSGVVHLGGGERIVTAASYSTPVTFRVVCMSDKKDFRVRYAADQIIFNWEMNANELRVDGGPANGSHKPGFGALPSNQWVALEFVITKTDMSIYMNGQKRYRAMGDFSSVNEPLIINAARGPLQVKSVAVVK